MNRSISINIDRILDYYDVPQLFTGKDAVGTRYLCLLFDDENEYLFLGIKISSNRLASFLAGKEDLRDLYINPELKNNYYIIKYNKDNNLVLDELQGDITEEMLPSSGYYFQEEEKDTSIIEEAIEKNHPVIHLGFTDSTNSHSLPVNILAALTSHYQSMFTNCCKKLNDSIDNNDSQLNLFAYSHASFNVHMYAKSSFDLFGSSKIDLTLKVLDNLFKSSSEEDLMKAIEPLRGHTIKNYKNFIKELIDNEISVKYKWVSSILEPNVVTHKINVTTLKKTYDFLVKSSELENAIKKFQGIMIAADTKSGKWSLIDDNDENIIKGKADDPSILNGVILKNTKYKIVCNEVVKSNNLNFNDQTTLYLDKITQI